MILPSSITGDGNYYTTISPNTRYKFLTMGATGSTVIRGQYTYNGLTGDYDGLAFTGIAGGAEFLSATDTLNVYAAGVGASPISVIVEPIRLK